MRFVSSVSSETTTKKLETIKESHGDLSEDMLTMPSHSHDGVNEILKKTEEVLRKLHAHAKNVDKTDAADSKACDRHGLHDERIYANAYVDLAKVNVVGFDYDYTLVTYTEVGPVFHTRGIIHSS